MKRSGENPFRVGWERSGYLAARLLNDIMSGHVEFNVVKFGLLLTVHRQSTRGFGRTESRIFSAMGLIRHEACNGLTAADVTASSQGRGGWWKYALWK